MPVTTSSSSRDERAKRRDMLRGHIPSTEAATRVSGGSAASATTRTSTAETIIPTMTAEGGPLTRRRTRQLTAIVSSEKAPAQEEKATPISKRLRKKARHARVSYSANRTTTHSTATLYAANDDEVARQLAFSTASPAVVDIYNPPLRSTFCQCPSDASFVKGTRLFTQHLLTYGSSYTDTLRETEQRQLTDLFGPAVFLQPSTTTPTVVLRGPLQRIIYYGDDDPAETLLTTTLRYRPRVHNWSDPRTFLSYAHTLPRQSYLTCKMRAILINWMVEVGLEYGVSEEALHLSMRLLDAILARGPTQQQLNEITTSSLSDTDDDEEEEDSTLASLNDLDKNDPKRKWVMVQRLDFQALGCACIWIASKLEDHDAPSVEDLVYISDSSFLPSTLRFLEERICKQLSFRLQLITPLHYVNQFLRASHACPCANCQYDHPSLRKMVLYLLELSCLSFDLSYQRPSLLAAAAVYLGRATLGLRELNPDARLGLGYWTQTLAQTTGYHLKDLAETVLVMHKFHQAAEKSKLNASYDKFHRKENLSVASKTVVRIDTLGVDFGMELRQDEMAFSYTEPELGI